MVTYYRDLDDPSALLAPERDPVTGRLGPAGRSKLQEPLPAVAAVPRSPMRRWVAVTVPIAALVFLAGGALAVRGSSPDSATDARGITEPRQTVAEGPAISTSAPIRAPATTVGTTPTTTPTPTSSVAETSLPLRTSLTLTTGLIDMHAEATPNDPAATATVSGPFPGELTIECSASGCVFPLVTNSPGAVTSDGGVTLVVVGGRIVGETARVQPCTGSQGSTYTTTVVTDHDLTLSMYTEVDGLSVPSHVFGTIERFQPDAGYVPRVGEIVDENAEIGCAGQTLTFRIDAPLNLKQETP